MNKIDSFEGEYSFLSNFYPCTVVIDGQMYASSEHYYQAMKFADESTRRLVQYAPTPGQAKRVARGFLARADWDDVRVDVMRRALESKFRDGTSIASKLLNTGGSMLLEGNNWHDNFWGNCSCPACHEIYGRNMLGKLLMERRTALANLTTS